MDGHRATGQLVAHRIPLTGHLTIAPASSRCFDASVLTGPSGDAPRRQGCLPSDGPFVTIVTVQQPVIVGMMLEMSHAKYADLPADAPADAPASSDSAYLARLTQLGVVDRLDTYFDSIDDGREPHDGPGTPANEVIEHAKSIR